MSGQESRRVPVVLLSGFLGAGKTTALNHLLAQGLRERRLAVIVNDIGEIGIDGRLVQAGDLTVKELTSGCICCSAGDEFGATLDTLLRELRPEAILVETTGIANPLALLTVLHDERMRLETVLTVIDATAFARYRHYASVVELQVTFADLVAINKADLVDAEELAKATAIVRELNPRAVAMPTVRGAIDPQLLFGTLPTAYRDDLPAFIAAERARVFARHPEWAEPVVAADHDHDHDDADDAHADHDDHDDHAHEHQHEDHDHDHDDPLHGYHLDRDGIATVEWRQAQPLREEALARALVGLGSLGVYRAKGIVTLAGSGERCLVNYVAGRYDLETVAAAPGPSEMVCIGKASELARRAIRRTWDDCLAVSVEAVGA